MNAKQLSIFDLAVAGDNRGALAAALEGHGKTKTTGEAMDVLKKHRRELIDRGRQIAVDIATVHGKVHSRQVRAAMADELDPNENEFWLGAVFRSSLFEWTGQYHTYSDAARNIHERMVKVWRLRDGT